MTATPIKIKIYNSLTRQKETFQPIQPKRIKLYVCGVTVYDYCHIGHARTYATFDVMVRFFKYLNYDVTYVRNITDIDDKIIQRAEKNKEPTEDLVRRFTAIMHEEFASLNFLPPDLEPKATETIPEIIQFIQNLMLLDFAYLTPQGDVYYRLEKFIPMGYGQLSGQSLDHLKIGARVLPGEQKENPLDFVLWKAAKPGEPAWDSPFGKGRPGWHIECSAMSKKCLGAHFDIHGGGSDLTFPHHENEIAQSVAANQEKFANYWVHAGMVQIDNQKMSKSLGNFFIIRDVLKIYHPEVVRYFLTASHYRSQLNYSDENLKSAQASLTRLYTALSHLPDFSIYDSKEKINNNIYSQPYTERFIQAMADDFNIPEALAVLFEMAKEINKHKQSKSLDKSLDLLFDLSTALKNLGQILGILFQSPENFLKNNGPMNTKNNKNNKNTDETNLSDEAIENLINLRQQAKNNKNYAEADRIRKELNDAGIILEDTPGGITHWRKTLE